MNIKGSLPLLILDALSKGASYGYQMAKDIRERSGAILDFQEGALYPTLHKLEDEGKIEAYTMVVEGRQRRYYRLTPVGEDELAEQRDQWLQYVEAVDAVLGA
ncbi:MAG: PadR family transcriptional regulator [Anaerolineae bacterium]